MRRIENKMSLLHLPYLFLFGLLLVPNCLAVKIIVGPGRTECISEPVGDEHFTIPGGPRIDGRVMVSGYSQYFVPFVTIKINAPDGEQIWTQQHVYSETHFNVGARGAGTYSVCFYNPWESRTDAVVDLVYFTLAHLRRSGGGSSIQVPKGRPEDRNKEVANADHMDEMKQSVLGLSEFLQVLQGSQRYLQRKLDRHMETMVSNRFRTLFYTGLEVFILLAMVLLQVVTITRFFAKKSGGRVKMSV